MILKTFFIRSMENKMPQKKINAKSAKNKIQKQQQEKKINEENMQNKIQKQQQQEEKISEKNTDNKIKKQQQEKISEENMQNKQQELELTINDKIELLFKANPHGKKTIAEFKALLTNDYELKEEFNNWLIKAKKIIDNDPERGETNHYIINNENLFINRLEFREYLLSQIRFAQIEFAQYLKQQCIENFLKESIEELNLQIFLEIQSMQQNIKWVFVFLIDEYLPCEKIKKFILLNKIHIKQELKNEDFKNIIFILTSYISIKNSNRLKYKLGYLKPQYKEGTHEYEKEMNENKKETIIEEVLAIIKDYKKNMKNIILQQENIILQQENIIPQQEKKNILELMKLQIEKNLEAKKNGMIFDELNEFYHNLAIDQINLFENDYDLAKDFDNWIIHEKTLFNNDPNNNDEFEYFTNGKYEFRINKNRNKDQNLELIKYILSQIGFAQIEFAQYLKQQCLEKFLEESTEKINMQIFLEIQSMQNNLKRLYPYLIYDIQILEEIKNFIELYKIKTDLKVRNKDFRNMLFDLAPYIYQRTLNRIKYQTLNNPDKKETSEQEKDTLNITFIIHNRQYQKTIFDYKKEMSKEKQETIIKITDIISIIQNYKPNNNY